VTLDYLKSLLGRPGRELRAWVVRVGSDPVLGLKGTRFRTWFLRATTRAIGFDHW
jgi:hypothetical protein